MAKNVTCCSEEFDVQSAVRQSSILSSMLFLFSISDVLHAALSWEHGELQTIQLHRWHFFAFLQGHKPQRNGSEFGKGGRIGLKFNTNKIKVFSLTDHFTLVFFGGCFCRRWHLARFLIWIWFTFTSWMEGCIVRVGGAELSQWLMN